MTTQNLIDKYQEEWNTLFDRWGLTLKSGETIDDLRSRIAGLTQPQQDRLEFIESELEGLYATQQEEAIEWQREQMAEDMERTYQSMMGEL